MRIADFLTEHFDVSKFGCYFEIMMPDGRYLYYEFDNNHKITDKCIWQL